MIFAEDYPKRGEKLPRALAEHVMAQVEDPANLDRWDDPGRRLITLILIRCGLRIGDACRLPADCIVADGDGQPYLRYYNHKMKREALVPVDEEIVTAIGRQRQRNAARWPGGAPVLFPRPTKNIAGTIPANGDAYRGGLAAGWRPATSAARTAPRSGSPRTSSATRWERPSSTGTSPSMSSRRSWIMSLLK